MLSGGYYHGYKRFEVSYITSSFCCLYESDIPLPGWMGGKKICEILGYDNQWTLTYSLLSIKNCGYIARSSKRNQMSVSENQS